MNYRSEPDSFKEDFQALLLESPAFAELMRNCRQCQKESDEERGDLPPIPEPPPGREESQPLSIANVRRNRSTLDLLPPSIGPYTPLEILGQGGMGTVYLAQQSHPIRRRVALKLIKLGMDTREVVARFESERQALAMMNHPNIARVYDAGATEDGRPYFAMEAVEGVPITEYCDRQKLSIPERLRLFVQVCRAVEHAHHRGVIHRDLKPSNVLVGTPDDKPVAKIIDFGVARATDQRLTEKTIYTELGRAIGTPAYMSPEQAEMSGESVDTRSDIYSLGVVLYEILVGELPLDWAALSKAAFDEVVRRIREEDPPTPSTRWTRLSLERGAELAKRRATSPASVVSAIRGDLDWITMKAMEKERGRRYGTANELARDIERHLADEPVLAGPQSIVYRLQKFVRKNRGAVAAVTAVFLALSAGLVVSTVLYLESRANERWAREEQDLTTAALVESETQQRNAERESAKLIFERGIELLEESNRYGLFDLMKARATAEGIPGLRESLSLLWSGWHEVWAVRSPRLFRRSGYRNSVAFSPDGNLIACPTGNKAVRLWETATGRSHGAELPHGEHVHSVSFSPDGKLLATGSAAGTVRLWKTATGRLHTPPMAAGKGEVDTVLFSADGELLAAAVSRGGNVRLRLWKTGTGEPHREPLAFPEIKAVAFSPDSSLLATADWEEPVGYVRLWTTSTLEPHGPPMEHRLVPDLAFSPDGKLLATAHGDGNVLIRKTSPGEVGKEHVSPLEHPRWVFSLRFSPDGKFLATGDRDGGVRVWRTATGKLERELPGHRNRIWELAYSPDGRYLASASADRTARVWSTDTFQEHGPPLHHPWGVLGVSFSPDGERLAVSTYEQAHLWSTDPMRLRNKLLGDERHVRALAFSPDGQHLATASFEHLGLWSTESLQSPRWRMQLDGTIVAVAFSRDGELLAAAGSRPGQWSVRFWDVATGTPRTLLVKYDVSAPPPSMSMALSPDLDFVATAGRWVPIKLWPLDRSPMRPRPLAEKEEGENLRGIAGLAFSPDGHQLAAALETWTARVWDTATGTISRTIQADERACSVAFSPDGQLLAVASENRLTQLWKLDKGRPQGGAMREGRAMRNRVPVSAMAFGPDGEILATVEDDRVRLWSVALGGVPLGLSFPHPGEVHAVAFSPDGKWVATGSQGIARLWRLPERTDDLEEMRRRTRVTLGARRDPEDVVWGFSPRDSPELEDELWALDERQRRRRGETVTDHQSAYERADRYDHVAGIFHQAKELVVAGRRAEAAANFDVARKLLEGPTYPFSGLCNDLARTYVTGPPEIREPPKALPLALKAVELRPESPHFLNTLGLVYYRVAQFRKAAETLQRAVERKTDGGTAFEHFFLCMLCHRFGELVEAREHYDRAMKWWNDRESVSPEWRRQLDDRDSLSPEWRKQLIDLRAEADALMAGR